MLKKCILISNLDVLSKCSRIHLNYVNDIVELSVLRSLYNQHSSERLAFNSAVCYARAKFSGLIRNWSEGIILDTRKHWVIPWSFYMIDGLAK